MKSLEEVVDHQGKPDLPNKPGPLEERRKSEIDRARRRPYKSKWNRKGL